MTPPRCRILIAALILLLLGALVFAHLRLRIYAYDDAYIHFRIAQNLVDYGVPYFNPAEQVMVTSSVGWTMVLYLLEQGTRLLPGSDLPAWTAVLNALATGLGALVFLRLLQQASAHPFQGQAEEISNVRGFWRCETSPKPPKTPLGAQMTTHPVGRNTTFVAIFFLAAYLSQMIKPSLGLMETPLALLLAGLALLGLARSQPASLLLFGALPFFRPELIVLTGLAALYARLVQHLPLKALGFLAAGALPFLLFEFIHFGGVLPHTLQAKAMVYSLGFSDVLAQWIARGIDDILLVRFFYNPPVTHPLAYAFYVLLFVVSGMALFLYRQGRAAFSRKLTELDAQALLWAGWCLLTMGGYLLARVKLFTWYEPLYLIPGLLVISRGLLRPRGRLVAWAAVPLLLAQLLGLGEVALGTTVSPVYYQDYGEGARVRQYLAVGGALYECYPQARLLTSEIGGLGYTFRGEILDGAGLATPAALAYHPMPFPEQRRDGSIGAIPPGFIAQAKPEIIVSYDVFIQSFMDSPAANEYTHLRLPLLTEEDLALSRITSFWDSTALNIFLLRDLAGESGQVCPALGP